jgi:putative ABC transport system substrate-binding protein
MRRRDFIKVIGCGAAVWPLAVHAQQEPQMRRIGVLVAYADGDPEMRARLSAFRHGLEQLGWFEGHNIHIDIRFAPAGAGQEQMRAQEVVASSPM